MSDIVMRGDEAWTRREWERVHGAEAGSPDDAGLTVDEQFRRDVEADRLAAEARDAEDGDTRTSKDHLQRSAERLREALGDLNAEAALMFENLMESIDKIAEVRVTCAAPISEPKPAPEPEPEPVVEYAPESVYDSIRLCHPLNVNGQRFEELTFNPPAFSDVEAVLRGDLSEIEMHARMAGVPVAVLRALRWTDSEVATFYARRLAPELAGA